MLDHGVRPGEDQTLVPVLEPHEIGRPPVGPADLDDLSEPVMLTHGVPVNVQAVSNRSAHPRLLAVVPRPGVPISPQNAMHRKEPIAGLAKTVTDR